MAGWRSHMTGGELDYEVEMEFYRRTEGGGHDAVACLENCWAGQADFDARHAWNRQGVAVGVQVELDLVAPFSRGGGSFGVNFEYTSDNGFQGFHFYTPLTAQSEGFQLGVGGGVNFGRGSGAWSGMFNQAQGNVGPVGAGVFWSPGSGGYTGMSLSVGAGPVLGASYTQTNYVPWWGK